jgi:type IV pilus biogenesis protein CpaD/CtpE
MINHHGFPLNLLLVCPNSNCMHTSDKMEFLRFGSYYVRIRAQTSNCGCWRIDSNEICQNEVWMVDCWWCQCKNQLY